MKDTIYIWTDLKDNKTELNKEELFIKMKEIIASTDLDDSLKILDNNGHVGLNGHWFVKKKEKTA